MVSDLLVILDAASAFVLDASAHVELLLTMLEVVTSGGEKELRDPLLLVPLDRNCCIVAPPNADVRVLLSGLVVVSDFVEVCGMTVEVFSFDTASPTTEPIAVFMLIDEWVGVEEFIKEIFSWKLDWLAELLIAEFVYWKAIEVLPVLMDDVVVGTVVPDNACWENFSADEVLSDLALILPVGLVVVVLSVLLLSLPVELMGLELAGCGMVLGLKLDVPSGFC